MTTTNTTTTDTTTYRLHTEDGHPQDADDLEITEEEYDALVAESMASAQPEGWVRTSRGVSVYADD
jgi:hypothetical protein